MSLPGWVSLGCAEGVVDGCFVLDDENLFCTNKDGATNKSWVFEKHGLNSLSSEVMLDVASIQSILFEDELQFFSYPIGKIFVTDLLYLPEEYLQRIFFPEMYWSICHKAELISDEEWEYMIAFARTCAHTSYSISGRKRDFPFHIEEVARINEICNSYDFVGHVRSIVQIGDESEKDIVINHMLDFFAETLEWKGFRSGALCTAFWNQLIKEDFPYRNELLYKMLTQWQGLEMIGKPMSVIRRIKTLRSPFFIKVLKDCGNSELNKLFAAEQALIRYPTTAELDQIVALAPPPYNEQAWNIIHPSVGMAQDLKDIASILKKLTINCDGSLDILVTNEILNVDAGGG